MESAEDEITVNTANEPKYLPPEIWDMILGHLFSCSYHTRANPRDPCLQLHQPPRVQSFLPLRLVSRDFHYRLTPPLFHHMIARSPRHRMRMLRYFGNKPRLNEHIRVLWMEVSPHDMGGKMRRVTQAVNIPAAKKLLHYFEVLPEILGPMLRQYTRLNTLHLTTTYEGLIEKRLPKSELLPQCFDALCASVRRAALNEMEDVMLGMPYEGGYANFFEGLDDPKFKMGLKNLGKGLKSAAIKLYDHQGNFTRMPFF